MPGTTLQARLYGLAKPRVYGLVKRSPLGPWVNRVPAVRLSPQRHYLWAHVLMQTRHVEGAVLEVGCWVGGTAVWCDRMLRIAGVDKPYIGIDTFSGFVEEQFEADVAIGTPKRLRNTFSYNSLSAVRRSAAKLGAPDVRFVQGDIVSMPQDRLPQQVSACLVDVDLSQPVYAALAKVYPLLAPGGVILVDDCPPGDDYQAREGYQRFVQEQGLSERYALGMGVVAGPEADICLDHLQDTADYAAATGAR